MLIDFDNGIHCIFIEEGFIKVVERDSSVTYLNFGEENLKSIMHKIMSAYYPTLDSILHDK